MGLLVALFSIRMNPREGERSDAQLERKLNVTGAVTLDVSVRSGRVRIRGGEEGVVTIRGVLRAQASIFSWIHHHDSDVGWLAANPPVRQEGNSIQIGDGWDRWLLRRIHFTVDITTPADTRVRVLGDSADLRVESIHGPVDCETDSGEIQIASIHSTVSASSDSGAIYVREVEGSVDTRTDSGGIEALRIGGGIEARTDSGEIEIANTRSTVSACSDSGAIHLRDIEGSVDLRTDSGEIEALHIAGGIDAHTDSGRIRLSQTRARPVYANSDSGCVRMKLAEDGGYSIRVRTDDGRIEIPEMTQARSSSHEVAGAVRGGGSVGAIETDSGDVEIG
jgi:DUF4097 and DUF4098 domain-containing protein YvlB